MTPAPTTTCSGAATTNDTPAGTSHSWRAQRGRSPSTAARCACRSAMGPTCASRQLDTCRDIGCPRWRLYPQDRTRQGGSRPHGVPCTIKPGLRITNPVRNKRVPFGCLPVVHWDPRKLLDGSAKPRPGYPFNTRVRERIRVAPGAWANRRGFLSSEGFRNGPAPGIASGPDELTRGLVPLRSRTIVIRSPSAPVSLERRLRDASRLSAVRRKRPDAQSEVHDHTRGHDRRQKERFDQLRVQ